MPDDRELKDDDTQSVNSSSPQTDLGRDIERERSLAEIESQLVGESGVDVSDSSSLQPSVQPATYVASSLQTPKKRKKWPIIAGVIAVVLIVLGSSAGAVYAFWYQNPDKVIADGLINAVTANTATLTGTVSYKYNNEVGFDVSLDTKGSKSNGSNIKATGSIRLKDNTKIPFEGEAMYAPNGDVYFRSSNLSKTIDTTVDTFINQMGGSESTAQEKKTAKTTITNTINPLIKKIDNQWVKISLDDMQEYNKDAKTQYECVQKVAKKIENDPQVANDIKKAYQANKLILVKESLGTVNGSMGYVIDVDKDAAKKFGEAIKNLPVSKEIVDCLESDITQDDLEAAYDSEIQDDSKADSRVEVWFDQWDHSVTRINATSAASVGAKQSLTLDLKTTFNKPVEVTLPKDAMSLKDLQNEIKKIIDANGTSIDQQATQSVASPRQTTAAENRYY